MSTQWYEASKPEEMVEKPWICPAAMAFFELILNPEMRVLEHGCGGSTVWLAKRVKQVTAVENRIEWLKAVEQRGRKNIKLMLWDEDHLPSLKGKFDLIFIDGEPVERRGLWLKAAPELLKSDGWIVLDNANRSEYAAELAELEQLAARKVGYRDSAGKHFMTNFYHVIRVEGK